jgi:hypothetical protein
MAAGGGESLKSGTGTGVSPTQPAKQRYGFVALPVVNYYFEVLKTAVEQRQWRYQSRNWQWRRAICRLVTHDIVPCAVAASAKVALLPDARRSSGSGCILHPADSRQPLKRLRNAAVVAYRR